MSGSNLTLRPELCDQCGRCVAACPRGELRVGGGYIYVDASACDGCLSCASVCDRGAIGVRRAAAQGGGLAVKPGEVAHVVVGSRAEAKALRKAAQQQAKSTRPTPRRKSEPRAAANPRPIHAAATNESGEQKASAKPIARTSAAPAPRSTSAAPSADGAVWASVDALAVAAVLVASLVAKEALLRSAAVQVMPVDGRAVARAMVLGIFYIVQIALLAFLAHRRGMTLPKAFRLSVGSADSRAALGSAGLVLGLLVGTRVVSTGWGALSQALGFAPPASESLAGVFGSGAFGLALTVALVVFVSPIVEELAFRGVIAGALDVRFGLRVALVGSAAAFAVYHMTLWVIVPTFVLGLALAWLALTRETLWPAVVLHVLYNGVVVAAVLWLR